MGALIEKLLTPLSLEKLLSHEQDLPHYAEAAPDRFLDLLDADLKTHSPALIDLLKPLNGGILGDRCARSGLLWALECLAWRHLWRVSRVLAELSRTAIDDRWANKPIASLRMVYQSRLPQTAEPLEVRIAVLERLAKSFPDVAWEICVDQLDTEPRIGHYSYRPRWRDDASGAGRSVRHREFHEFTRKALDLSLAWPDHTHESIGELVQRLAAMPEEDRNRVWDLVDDWAEGATDERAKGKLREVIRSLVHTRRGRLQWPDGSGKERAHSAYEKLEPANLIERHEWLFAQQWVEPSLEEVEDEGFDYTRYEGEIWTGRARAMREILVAGGVEGVMELLSGSEAPEVIGRSVGLSVTSMKERVCFLEELLSMDGEIEAKIDACLHGFLVYVGVPVVARLLASSCDVLDFAKRSRALRCSPFSWDTWRLLDEQDEEVRDAYWKRVLPYPGVFSEEELMEIVDRLLEAGRPRAAFYAVGGNLREVETARLRRLLLAVGTEGTEPDDWYRVDAYRISDALDSLDGRPGVSVDEMAQLEFMFMEALDHSTHGIPNLGRRIGESATLFVQAVRYAFGGAGEGEEMAGVEAMGEEARRRRIGVALRLFGRIGHIPGTREDGTVSLGRLLDWMTEVRRLCREHGLLERGDEKIGELLSRAPRDRDGLWPCRAVCEAMESVASKRIGVGFHIGVVNGRAVHWRGIYEGGGQDRELAAKYRACADEVALEFPYVSRVIGRVAEDYDQVAREEDAEARVGMRLGH